MNKFLKVIEEMGYVVDYNNDISKIKIFDKEGNELDSLYNNKINDQESSYVTFIDKINKRDIYIYENGVIKVRVNDHMVISTYNEYDINNVHCDYETNNVFFISINNSNRPEYSIRIDLHKYANGYNDIVVNVFKSFNLTGKYEDLRLNSGKLNILKLDEGANVYLGGNTLIYEMSESECTTDNYINIIRKHINNIMDFSSNTHIQDGINIIVPSLSLFIEELLDYWKDNKENITNNL